MQIDDLVDRRQDDLHQFRILLRALHRRLPHPLVQGTYFGEQGLDLIAPLAT